MGGRITIIGEDGPELEEVKFLPRVLAKIIKGPKNGDTISPINFSKKGEVVNKEEVRDMGSPSTYLNRRPLEGIHLMMNSS